MQLSATAALSGLMLLVGLSAASSAQTEEAAEPAAGPPTPSQEQCECDHWLDRTQLQLHERVWRSGMWVDRMFGSKEAEEAYQSASGSIAPALLWDEFDGFQPQLRFQVNMPLPQLNERFDAFIGRVNREEYVTERAQPSGAFRRQYGPIEDDQTLFGIRYHEPEEPGGRWDAGAGVRVRFPLDPYVKGSYVYQRGTAERLLLSLRETVFWQNSEELGLTSRVDFTRVFDDRMLLRWTLSGTFSQESEGVRGYSTISMLRGFPNRRAMAAEVFVSGEFDAIVPLGEYGTKVAWRQSVARDWLVLELRTSVTWPKDHPDQPRKPSWGVGVGFEMSFGTDQFLARPTTF